MNDFLENELAVGDVVLYIHRTGRTAAGYVKATVAGFTKCRVNIQFFETAHGRTYFKEMTVNPEKLAKIQ